MPVASSNEGPDGGSADLGSVDVPDLGKYLVPGRSLTVDDRKITVEQAAGPLGFTVTDEEGESEYSDVRRLPDWAVRRLIEYYAETPTSREATAGMEFEDPYTWLEALLRPQKHPGLSSSGNEGRVEVYRDPGPLQYVVSDGNTEQTYSSLDDVPDIDAFEPGLVQIARDEMEAQQRRRRTAARRQRLDEMFDGPGTDGSSAGATPTDPGEPPAVEPPETPATVQTESHEPPGEDDGMPPIEQADAPQSDQPEAPTAEQIDTSSAAEDLPLTSMFRDLDGSG
jgi:hypothetical protein